MTRSKVRFDLVQDDDGYPPFPAETVWATSTSNPRQYIIDNIPFFARQATLGDLVEVTRSSSELVFNRVVVQSSNSLIRIVPYVIEMVTKIRSDVYNLGCSTEWFADRSVIAVNIPIASDIKKVQAYLSDLERQEILGYEEAILRQ